MDYDRFSEYTKTKAENSQVTMCDLHEYRIATGFISFNIKQKFVFPYRLYICARGRHQVKTTILLKHISSDYDIIK